jgi:hypothetical protein
VKTPNMPVHLTVRPAARRRSPGHTAGDRVVREKQNIYGEENVYTSKLESREGGC